MKRFNEFKSTKYIKMTDKPIIHYPVDYKCTFIYDIEEKLTKNNIDVYNIGEPEKTKYGEIGNEFYRWIHKKLQINNTIYPNSRTIDIYPKMSNDSRNMAEGGSVVLLPKHYDSSDDLEISRKEKEKGLKYFRTLAEKRFGDNTKKIDDHMKSIEDNVIFNTGKYDWVNIALDVIYKEYKQYYINGFLRVWLPQDWDYDNSFQHNSDGNPEHDYPIKKMLFLSEIESYLKSNYDLSDELFYQFIINNSYIEGRYWEIPESISFSDDTNTKFIRTGSKYGMNSTPTIDKMLGILEVEYSELMKEQKPGWGLPIYIDYYKKIKQKY